MNSLRDTRNNTTHIVVECELSMKLHDKDVEVGTCSNGNPIKDQVPIGRAHSPASANN